MGEAGVGIDLLGGPGEREGVVVGPSFAERGCAQVAGRIPRERVASGVEGPPLEVAIGACQGEHVAEGIGGDGLPGGGVLQHGEDAAGATGAFERAGGIRAAHEAPALGGAVGEGGLDA